MYVQTVYYRSTDNMPGLSELILGIFLIIRISIIVFKLRKKYIHLKMCFGSDAACHLQTLYISTVRESVYYTPANQIPPQEEARIYSWTRGMCL